MIDKATFMLEQGSKGSVKVISHWSGVSAPINPVTAKPAEIIMSATPGARGTPIAASNRVMPLHVEASFKRAKK
jgi:hypothetical protein